MMRVLDPTYTLRIEIRDPFPTQQTTQLGGGTLGAAMQAIQRKFYAPESGKTGCDEALAAVKKALADAGLNAAVSFERFEQK